MGRAERECCGIKIKNLKKISEEQQSSEVNLANADRL